MCDADLKHPTITQVPFGGRLVQLSSPSSQELRLQGVGPITLAWEPDGKEAFQIEVRARIQSNNAAQESFPVVRWSVEVSQGEAIWAEPFPTTSPATILQHNFRVPARGMAWRTGSRNFRITFAGEGVVGNPTFALQASLLVTILPVWGTEVDTYPYTDSQGVLGATPKGHPFPITAREWRVFTAAGLPFPLGTNTMSFVSLNTGPIVGGTADEYAEWRPIPFEAVAWAAELDGTYVSFR